MGPRANTGPAVFGSVVRVYCSNVVRVIGGLLGICDSTKAEVVGPLIHLRKLVSIRV